MTRYSKGIKYIHLNSFKEYGFVDVAEWWQMVQFNIEKLHIGFTQFIRDYDMEI